MNFNQGFMTHIYSGYSMLSRVQPETMYHSEFILTF